MDFSKYRKDEQNRWIIPLSDYNKLHKDYRGLINGKKTFMPPVNIAGTTCLWIESEQFIIV